MIFTMPDENAQLHGIFDRLQSYKTVSFENDTLRQWFIVIGLITVILLLLLVCIRCISQMRYEYQKTNINEEYPTSCKSCSQQKLLVNRNECICKCYPKVKSIDNTRQILTQCTKYQQINDNDYRISLPNKNSSMYTV
ncbi:unnamed protein product [Adineta steineri]|uniref:Uncharacterized protein n=1 Tax=Adineta steineri TaxID=433720 RepID=A0A813XJ44_9BILA|nr:unnamed protein product [Adineta steineri]CAF1324190.1 unnamed protein product [Adineta steineri]